MEKEYIYCSVLPRGKDEQYLYLFKGEHIEKGDKVFIPFGVHDRVGMGTVMDVTVYRESEVPYPVDEIKEILRVITEKELKKIEDIDNHLEESENCNVKKKAICFVDEDELDRCYDFDKAILNDDWEGVWNFVEYYMFNDIPKGDSLFVKRRLEQAYLYCLKHFIRIKYCAFELGKMYYLGDGVIQSYELAAILFEMAAEHGNVEGFCSLGYCFYYGKHEKRDYQKAFKYFSQSALMDDARSLYKLGDMYLNGFAVEKNGDYAYDLYKKAEENARGEIDVAPNIQIRLGKCFMDGIGVYQELGEALKYFYKALCGFYARGDENPNIMKNINICHELIQECEAKLRKEIVKIKKAPKVSDVIKK